MEFVALLLVLGVYQLLGWRVRPEYDDWFYALRESVHARLPRHPEVALLLVLLLPLGAMGLLLSQFQHWLFGLLGILLHALLLFYGLGRLQLTRALETYLGDWNAGHWQSAYLHACQYFQAPPLRPQNQEAPAEDVLSLHRSVRAALLYQWFNQLFVVVFWYLWLGPLAALFMRLLYLYLPPDYLQAPDLQRPHGPDAGTSEGVAGALTHERAGPTPALTLSRLVFVLEWLPARLLSLTFCLAGNFKACFNIWTGTLSEPGMPAQEVLAATGQAALGIATDETGFLHRGALGADAERPQQCARELLALDDMAVRSLIIWVALCAIAVLS